jgi:ABC-type polysaccharide/polyol phosphate transport system ATPase subunit
VKSAVTFEHVSKCFRIEPERPRSLQERFMRTLRRTRHQVEDVWVLRDVSFSLPAGSSLGVVGQNGAGKSSLLKLCARVIDPTSGVVRTHGRVSALLELGVGFHPDLTGRENVREGERAHRSHPPPVLGRRQHRRGGRGR